MSICTIGACSRGHGCPARFYSGESGNDSILFLSLAACFDSCGHGESSGVAVMNTVLNHQQLSRTPLLCGVVSVMAATALGCGTAVGSFVMLDAVWSDPARAAEPTVLVLMLATSAFREKVCRERSAQEVDPV